MSRLSLSSHPMFLGFEEVERLLDRAGKSGGDGYPPYNIERLRAGDDGTDRLRITLAVAGFTEDQLDVTVENRQLVIRGRQTEEDDRDYLHRGIAARQFQRSFVLAADIEIDAATLENGLLAIDLVRQLPEKTVQRISIGRNTKV
ncbi:MAG: Hsp20 family protein [Pseudomonadota bacterium]